MSPVLKHERLASLQWPLENDVQRLPLGAFSLDARLRGGLPRAALHEIFAARSGDLASTSAFAMMLALRLADSNRPMLWIMEEKVQRNLGQLYPPGLIALGGNPDTMILIETRDNKDALRASADAIRSAAVAAVILSVYGKAPIIDLTATRRLSLAALRAKALVLLLRFDSIPVASAAYSRWQVAAAPSRPLLADAPGFPAFNLELVRHRGGVAPFATRVEWNHEQRSFRDSPLSSRLFAPIAGREVKVAERQSA